MLDEKRQFLHALNRETGDGHDHRPIRFYDVATGREYVATYVHITNGTVCVDLRPVDRA